MAHLGCPVVGDVRYGDADRDRRLFEQRPAEKRLYLHAGALSFPHPAGGTLVSLRAEPPACFAALSTPALPARRSA
jgi:23S rRNA-/tRNA-specific pseudouridylate synthase